MWTYEEERRLLELVGAHGPRSWTRISAELGNRSDVQCRYHYLQMVKGQRVQDDAQNAEEPRTQPAPGLGVARLPVSERVPRRPLLPPIGHLIAHGR
jgi:hypothetical protein